MNYLRMLQLRRVAGDMGGAAAAAEGATGTATASKGGADSATAQASQTNAATAEQSENSAEVDKTFTQTDVSRIVRETIAKERRRAEAAVASARTEAERLATMTAEQRTEHERQQREAELQRREAEVTRRELHATALQTLGERELPQELAELLDYGDADRCSASIDTLEKTFRKAVQKGVETRMKGATPAAGAGSANSFEAKLRAAAGLK